MPSRNGSSALLLILLGCAGQDAAPSPRPPNVLFVITDDQGYGDLRCHGNPQIHTPHIDALAKQSTELDRFHVCPVCSPTRSTLLTGRYNYRTGVVDTFLGRSLLRPDEVTLAELLRDAGYRTGLFGKWHLGDNYPLRAQDQGFQETLSLRGGGIGQPSDPPGGDHYQDPTLYRNGVGRKMKGYVTDLITDGAIDFVRDNRARPFFAWIAYNAPHTPLEAPEGYLERYRDLPETTARIYAMVTNIDDNVGRLLKTLGELGLERDTIVVFMTDNGPQQDRFNAGMRGKKGTVFDGGIRVPFYIRWPGRFDAGRKIDRVTAHVDVLPTLLDACGVAKPAVQLDGRSMMPLLSGSSADWPDRTLFFQWHRGDAPELGRDCAARTARWKLVRQQPSAKPLLFDMQADPLEKTDVAAANPEVAARLNSEYEAWFRDVGSRGYEPSRVHVGSEAEDPVLLTRQDLRGTPSGRESAGHWEVEVEKAGPYDLRLLFHGPASKAHLDAGRIQIDLEVPPGAQDVTFRGVELPAGPLRLAPTVSVPPSPRGVDYVEITRR